MAQADSTSVCSFERDNWIWGMFKGSIHNNSLGIFKISVRPKAQESCFFQIGRRFRAAFDGVNRQSGLYSNLISAAMNTQNNCMP